MGLNIKRTRLLLILLTLTVNLAMAFADTPNARKFTIRGKITTDNDGEAASFAIVSLEEIEIKALCDIDGNFTITNVPQGAYSLNVQCLGYQPLKKKVAVNKNVDINLKMLTSSFSLNEFEVMARKSRLGKVVVDETALEYIQPTSLADVMLLLPGNVYKENNMTSFSQISSRQVGSDANTSLGVGIVADGAPVSNDGVRTQMVGVTDGSYDSEIASRTGINKGADMRYISTDHIQSVEFTRGITSAKYGNLSSGMINISSKHGVTPLRIRMKADLKNKLGYVGKGWRLGEKTGTLNLGVDYLHSINDVRNEMDKFDRMTAQMYYNNKVSLGKYSLDIDGKLSQTMTFNKMKKDELTYEYEETYKADYARTALMMKGNLQLGLPWIDKLEMMASADYTYDRITRHRMVLSSSGPMNLPVAYEEGENEGIYLPGKYYSDFYIDNKPLNINVQLNAVSRWELMRNLMVNMQYGIEYTNVKNHGEGAVTKDETKPAFPYDNSYMRPRPNYDIPALATDAGYVQADFIWDDKDRNSMLLSAGMRASMLTNLPDDYYLNNRVLADPRLNASYTYGRKMKHTIRMGYGQESKTPTLDYLYPEKVYKDFYMLNAYTNDPQYRHLITYTSVFDVSNKDLRENKNRKMEIGYDLDYNGLQVAVTGFYEKSTSGFEYFTQYYPMTYNLYTTLKEGVSISGRTPQKSDYVEEQYSIFTSMKKVMNSSKVIKRGVEYRIILPKIKPLLTKVEINGAYYQTDYSSALPTYYYPGVRIANREYPYVGIYHNGARNQYRRLNSNIWLNTHIPKFKLMLTNFFQIVWMNTSQYKDNMCYTPQEYLDFEGSINYVDDNVLSLINSEDATFRYLKRTILPIEYARDEKPVSMLWNIKATKEFGKGIKLSFFANGLLDINPKYTSGGKTTQRTWTDPYFGMELFFNFNL